MVAAETYGGKWGAVAMGDAVRLAEVDDEDNEGDVRLAEVEVDDEDNEGDVPNEENLIGASVVELTGEWMTIGEANDSIPLAGPLFSVDRFFVTAS